MSEPNPTPWWLDADPRREDGGLAWLVRNANGDVVTRVSVYADGSGGDGQDAGNTIVRAVNDREAHLALLERAAVALHGNGVGYEVHKAIAAALKEAKE